MTIYVRMLQVRCTSSLFCEYFQFLPRDAMHKRGLCRHAVSVCVCVSVTFVDCVKTNKDIWGIGLAGCRFLCAGKYIALLTEHEWGGPQHPGHEGVKSPGILFTTWRAQGVMNGWLFVFLSRICCHKAS